MSRKSLVIAIDGPAGAGKSTVARGVAKQLGYLYVDTGAMYRALTWKAIEEGIDLEDEKTLVKLARRVALRLRNKGKETAVEIAGKELGWEIRTPELSAEVFHVAQVAGVRERMVELQREMAREGRVVLEGRDIGTVVFPDADLKIYLDASLEERARRKCKQMETGGEKVTLEQLKEEVATRDARDKGRGVAPLRVAEGAVVIDTTNLTIEEEIAMIVKKAEQGRGEFV